MKPRPIAPPNRVMQRLRELEAEEARKGKSRVAAPGYMLSAAESAAAVRLVKELPPLAKKAARKAAKEEAPRKVAAKKPTKRKDTKR